VKDAAVDRRDGRLRIACRHIVGFDVELET
jgi:hypothetical protein